MNRKVRILTTLLVIVVGGILIWKSTANRLGSWVTGEECKL